VFDILLRYVHRRSICRLATIRLPNSELVSYGLSFGICAPMLPPATPLHWVHWKRQTGKTGRRTDWMQCVRWHFAWGPHTTNWSAVNKVYKYLIRIYVTLYVSADVDRIADADDRRYLATTDNKHHVTLWQVSGSRHLWRRENMDAKIKWLCLLLTALAGWSSSRCFRPLAGIKLRYHHVMKNESWTIVSLVHCKDVAES